MRKMEKDKAIHLTALVLILALLFLASSTYRSTSKPSNFPQGIYLLLPAGEYPPEELIEEDFIRGISVRVHWRDLEVKPGEFNWGYLDEMFSLAEREDKYLFLRLIGGFWAPKWIYDEGVEAFEVELRAENLIGEAFIKRYGDRVLLPKVWEDKYLTLWGEFVQAVGRRYSSNPRLVLVHMAGPTFFSAEPILARDGGELERLKANGFTDRAALRAWRETFKVYEETFPEKRLSLNLNYIIQGDDDLLVSLWDLALHELNHRLVLQGNWLGPSHLRWLYKDSEVPEKSFYRIFSEARSKGLVLGFQTVGPLSKLAQRRGVSSRKLFRLWKGLIKLSKKFNVDYLEVYPEDLRDAQLRTLWEGF